MFKKVLIACLLSCLMFSKAELHAKKSYDVKELTSKSGVKFWFLKDSSSPLVHIKIAFKNSGASFQEQDKMGIPEFYSNAVFCGSGKYSKLEFEKACSEISIFISCRSGIDALSFSMVSPKMVLIEAASLFNAAISAPNFEEDKVRKIQNNIGYGMQNYAGNPIKAALNTLIPAEIFQSHAYENGAYGSSENFLKLSISDLKDYKSKFLVTASAQACVFGDLSENEAIALVDKTFSGVPKGSLSDDHIKDVTPNLSPKIKKYYTEGPQSTIFFVLKNEKMLSPKRFAASVLYCLLGAGTSFKSRIMAELRTKQGLIYYGGINFMDISHANYAVGILQTDHSKVDKAISAMKKIIKNLKEKGITKRELRFAQNHITGSLLVNLRTSGDLCYFYFWKMLDGFKTTALDDTLKGIQNVKLKDVNNLAKELLDENNLSFIVIGGNK